MNNSPKIALIGLGYWGKNLARNLYDLKVLNGICDNNLDNLDKYKSIYKDINYFSSIEELLNSDIDAVVIATPAITHGSLVKKALNAKKHVFVEKPLCLDYEEGLELKKIAKNHNLKLMVGHLLLYHPAFISLKEVFNNL